MKIQPTNNFKTHGYALIIILVFLLIFSFIGLHSLIYTKEMTRLTHDQITKDNDRLKARQILKQIESRIIDLSPSCTIQKMPAFLFANKSLSWWQRYGCHERFQQIDYYYVVEFLEEDSCSIIKEKQYNDNRIANYQRVTLCFIPRQSMVDKIILQSTLVKPIAENNSSCHDRIHFVSLGMQMIREL